MVKIEQTGGRLTEEEILHGKEDAYGIYQVNRNRLQDYKGGNDVWQ